MEQRTLGRTGRQVSVVGLGAWQIGADWGAVDDDTAMATLRAAADAGVTMIDTADVYGEGRSERLVGRLLRERPGEDLFVATKMGRRADPHESSSFTPEAFRLWNDRSRVELGLDTLDLVQLHCPPSGVYDRDELFDALDAMVLQGRMRAYGVSVETCAEALAAIARPNVASIQIILNVFRQKPLEEVLPAARAAGVGVIARVPLASGLLTGKYDESTTFGADDHRTFNRHGEAFDVGETFAGVDFVTGVAAAREVGAAAPDAVGTAAVALRWILDQEGVTTVIPGARTPQQAAANAAVADVALLPPETHDALRAVYDRRIRPLVHDRW